MVHNQLDAENSEWNWSHKNASFSGALGSCNLAVEIDCEQRKGWTWVPAVFLTEKLQNQGGEKLAGMDAVATGQANLI